MPIYMFMFGYESPLDAEHNEGADGTCGDDWESPHGFPIRARDEAQAIAWGKVLADRFVQRLFGDEHGGRWRDAGYAVWIESDPEDLLYKKVAATPPVAVGEYPD